MQGEVRGQGGRDGPGSGDEERVRPVESCFDRRQVKAGSFYSEKLGTPSIRPPPLIMDKAHI